MNEHDAAKLAKSQGLKKSPTQWIGPLIVTDNLRAVVSEEEIRQAAEDAADNSRYMCIDIETGGA
jgi:hypothetical protein